MAEPLRVGPDLVLAPGLRRDADQREAARARQGFEPGHRRLPVGADSGLHEHRARRVVAQGLVDPGHLPHLARQYGDVGLPHPPVLHGGLQAACHAGLLGHHNHPARLAVEPEYKVHRGKAQEFPGGPDKAGPGAVLGRMAHDVARLVDDEEAVVLVNQLRVAQLLGPDDPRRPLRGAAPSRPSRGPGAVLARLPSLLRPHFRRLCGP